MGVLVVDDDETLCKAIALVLEDEGYTVFQASNGEAALDVLRTVGTPLVVLLDWMMPVMDGLDVLSTVACEPDPLSQHAYVFMSAAVPAGLRQLAALSKVVPASVLIKPFTLTLLLEKVAEAAERLRHVKHGDGQSPQDRSTQAS